ncbi:formate dehydrogenase accessory sulfurtransferase FdhD [Hyperthermus butylicus]|uniref:Uncharacterized protein n=1 Tax=Hyperthermus butylicus (strain DSM 5456 / JCM 9403 / PLM1-5) TaxID=415426 RepID=A2BLN6_HYPBU|nr:formate dehydrogenase accessory sulfurtransferase FdhD [Hyperthermus butylicus]ABM80897.1 hypothetical protein Hbut_1054 [Hyperthermus butylicus DSM 5456]
MAHGNGGNAALSALRECSLATVLAYGHHVAADYEYEIIVDGNYLGIIHASPNYLDDAVAGLLLREGEARLGDHVVIEHVELVGPLRYRVRARRVEAVSASLPRDGTVEWDTVQIIYRDFVSRIPKKVCPYALHTIAVYMLGQAERIERLLVVSDASRHSAALKVAGALSRLASEGKLEGLQLVAVSTGRISADAVTALSAAGVWIIISNHHPLLSGLVEALKRGVTLVLRRPDGVGLAVYTSSWRVKNAPTIELELSASTPGVGEVERAAPQRVRGRVAAPTC